MKREKRPRCEAITTTRLGRGQVLPRRCPLQGSTTARGLWVCGNHAKALEARHLNAVGPAEGASA